MKNKGIFYLITMGTITFLLCLLISVTQFCLMDISYYENYFRIQETGRYLKTTQSNLIQGTESLLDYITGKSDETDISFKIDGEKQSLLKSSEKEALKDIQNSNDNLRFVRNIAGMLAIAFFLFAFLSMKNDKLTLLARGYIRGTIIFVFLIIILLLLVVIDQMSIGLLSVYTPFLAAINIFQTGLLARIFPSSFWIDMSLRIGLIFLLICSIVLIASIAYLSYRSYRRRALLELKEE